jgi:tRNA(Ile)-lysidine synthase
MPVNWDTFVEQTAAWLEPRGLLAPGTRWVLGVSGGPDSTLLLHVMHEIAHRRGLGWTLHVAHLHHGLRERDADADCDFARGLATSLGHAFHEERADLKAHLAREGGSTEEVARQKRYEFLERVALRTGSELVAIAHHADDDAETILHRVCRGTGLRGLAGMREIRAIQPGSRVRLVRPFLEQTRQSIERMCAERDIETRTDATNASLDFTRGRIRHAILPMIRQQINPNVSEALLRLAEQARWLGTYLEDAAARTFESLVVSEGGGRIVLNTRALLSKQKIIQAEVVRLAIALVVGGEQEIGFVHIESVLRLAADRASGKELHLPGPVVVEKVYERLEFRPLDRAESGREVMSPVFVVCPGTTSLAPMCAELLAEFRDIDGRKIGELRSSPHPYEEWIDCERVQFPLLVRGRREGDRFWPLGSPGSKSIGDFFSDEKVEPALRARTGILCDQVGPVWVMPLRIDERVKLRPTSQRALRLCLTPLDKI